MSSSQKPIFRQLIESVGCLRLVQVSQGVLTSNDGCTIPQRIGACEDSDRWIVYIHGCSLAVEKGGIDIEKLQERVVEPLCRAERGIQEWPWVT